MPKKTEKWECETCGTVYDTEIAAAVCEACHQKDISTFRPKLYYKPNKSYPNLIVLDLGCGDSAVYSLTRVNESDGGA